MMNLPKLYPNVKFLSMYTNNKENFKKESFIVNLYRGSYCFYSLIKSSRQDIKEGALFENRKIPRQS